MWQDPIVAEIHRTREKIAQAYGNDIHEIFAAAQRGELSKPFISPANKMAQQDAPADPRKRASPASVSGLS